jgi:hypothetical protein
MAQAYLQPGALSCLFRGGCVLVWLTRHGDLGLWGYVLRGGSSRQDTAHCGEQRGKVHSLHRSQTQWSGVGRGAEPEIRALVFQQRSYVFGVFRFHFSASNCHYSCRSQKHYAFPLEFRLVSHCRCMCNLHADARADRCPLMPLWADAFNACALMAASATADGSIRWTWGYTLTWTWTWGYTLL